MDTAAIPAKDALDAAPPRLWKRSPVRHNLLANLGGKGLTLLISLVCVPVYIHLLGIAGYGLIGVWTTLESLSNLVDLGLSPTITREMAACSARPNGAQDARDFVRTIEVGYWLIGVVIGALIISCASPIADHWLLNSQLPPATLRTAIILIGILILCRWPVTFYCGGLNGLERQVVLSVVSTTHAFLRSFGTVAILLFVSPTIFAFFVFQIAINAAGVALLPILMWRCLPAGCAPRFRPELVGRIWRFAGGTSAITLVGLLLSELDKVIVGAMLPLESFGYYMLGSRLAACLGVLSGPLFNAFYPAYSREAAARNDRKLAVLYHQGSQLMSALIIPSTLTVAFFANPLIFAWTGKGLVADQSAQIAAFLSAGLAVNCLLNMPYALQLAYGWTRLAFCSGLFSLAVTVPLLLLFTRRFGGAGAAGVCLIANVSLIFTNVIPMHRRLLNSEKTRWFIQDIGIPLLACAATGAFLAGRIGHPVTRVSSGFTVAFAGVILLGVAMLATPLTRKQLRDFLAHRRTHASVSA